jgi:hypothetical protein
VFEDGDAAKAAIEDGMSPREARGLYIYELPPERDRRRLPGPPGLPVGAPVRPSARLVIVGWCRSPQVRALASIDGVEVAGEVPDMRP